MSILRNTPVNMKSGLIEILLIFVGVTIAVTFGNWNDKRKDKIIEKNYLELLSGEVKENSITLDRMILKYNNKIEVLEENLGFHRTSTLQYLDVTHLIHCFIWDSVHLILN